MKDDRPGLCVAPATYLRDVQHADAMLCRLVAHHSCAIVEPDQRGLVDVLSREFEPAPGVHSTVLTYCDMTTSLDGEPVGGQEARQDPSTL